MALVAPITQEADVTSSVAIYTRAKRYQARLSKLLEGGECED